MKNFLLLITLLFSCFSQAQETTKGTIAGKLMDKEIKGETLPFANVIIKASNQGTTTDIDGLYSIDNLNPGTYTVIFSFVGYETLEVPNITVVAGKVTEINTALGSSAASLDEVVIKTVSRRDSQVALLLEQKKAIEIKESIGAQELAKMGVSDAATATTKISGVTSSEASGDIFVRGLGDRYLNTTMNGLPIPSDDVERKNIDLKLFSTNIIQSVSISKTYAAQNSADEASGNVDVSTRELLGIQELSAGLKVGINTNAIGKANNFKISPNYDNVNFGFYSRDLGTRDALTQQSWNTQTADFPLNYEYSITAGKKFGDHLKVLFTGSQDISFEHRQGVFREYRANFINDSITDAETFAKSVNTTGLLNASYQIDENNEVKATSLFINKLTDEVFEGGRNGEASIFEETEPAEDLSQFIRDQNTKQTRLWVNQLTGEHQWNPKNNLTWGVGYNKVDADEPNRIRNEVNFSNSIVQLGRTGGFQQRKSAQIINDEEFNGRIQNSLNVIEEEAKNLSFSLGGNYRNKERNFGSQFLGLEEATLNMLNPTSIDNLSKVFTLDNLQNGSLLINRLDPDRYLATLESTAGFLTANYGINKININLGVRYQKDDLNVKYDVGNIPGRRGESNKTYNNFYPSINLKYAANERNNFRVAASKTITLPEFKEIAPFEYVSPTGQVTRGNPSLEASTNYNLDIKWEFFPSADQLVSLTGFYKNIEDPISKVQDRGSAGIFSFFNSADKAEIFGLEVETKLSLLKAEEESGYNLDLNLNASRMWHSQDLKELKDIQGNFIRTFRYKGLTKTDLQGASDWIFNGSLNFSTNSPNKLLASVIANYASDKIYALGAPEIQTQSDLFYNDAIIEKGFVSLDALINQEFGEHFNLKLSGKNILNPEIKRTQNIKPSTTGIETTETVRSYTRGATISLGVGYKF
ncbi:outer membrane receptor protein involved in Fe transport [Gillisia mitskevichiae]|uniref:Outer membrane receptor protein involved in Fe transport n=1 Tax=Gillisia mitskevichiae TaxID=270921 RepID=A0A495PZA7_9FLAO|nr:TonB-dependent receptor [Gillisia mitskevichiae]RKS55840.1 outer membrane receptor protein involved in Fe transport [Gillisia mitskevichiae]